MTLELDRNASVEMARVGTQWDKLRICTSSAIDTRAMSKKSMQFFMIIYTKSSISSKEQIYREMKLCKSHQRQKMTKFNVIRKFSDLRPMILLL